MQNMLVKLAVSLGPVALILLLSEYLWRKKILRGERARKLIHIVAGVWIAFWPFYIPLDGIFILGVVMLTLVIYSRATNLFQAINDVKRKTFGDILFAVGFIICAYFGTVDWIFTISVLLLALADGGAAVVGRYWGQSNQYFVFGNKNLRKSIAGTCAFILLAVISAGIGYVVGGSAVIADNVALVLIGLPLAGALLENIMPYGLDNVATPLLATLLLNSLV
jgi:dolichol kinase